MLDLVHATVTHRPTRSERRGKERGGSKSWRAHQERTNKRESRRQTANDPACRVAADMSRFNNCHGSLFVYCLLVEALCTWASSYCLMFAPPYCSQKGNGRVKAAAYSNHPLIENNATPASRRQPSIPTCGRQSRNRTHKLRWYIREAMEVIIQTRVQISQCNVRPAVRADIQPDRVG